MTQIGHESQQRPKPCWTNLPAAMHGIGRWVSDFRRRTTFRAEIAKLERTGNLDRLLEDLGLTRWEMDKIAHDYPETERLLPNMAYRLGIELERLDASTLYDLRHGCAICNAHRACRHWLAVGSKDEARFCPNAALFAALRPGDPSPAAPGPLDPSTGGGE